MMSRVEKTRMNSQLVWDVVAKQFSEVYRKYRYQSYGEMLWGDELEYFLISTDESGETVTLSNLAESVLQRTQELIENGLDTFVAVGEACSFMLETIPRQPYSGHLEELHLVEENMTKRREILQRFLPEKVSLLTLPFFPRFCVELPDASFVERELLANKLYYKQVVKGTMSGAGNVYAFNVPVFQDSITEVAANNQAPELDQVFVNNPVFGMASSSLQVTIQAVDLQDAQYLYDQLSVLCPILTALTAGAPILRGHLLDTDSRVAIISPAIDDRPAIQRLPVDGDGTYQGRRYGSVHQFISDEGQCFNDVKHAYNKDVYQRLRKDGVEESMAMHVGIICTRNPLYHCELSVDDSIEYFEWLNGTTWPVVRLKIPQPDGTMGWRLEIRPMGSQITDFENAAFAVFVYLLSRGLREFPLNLLIPISKVHENLEKAWLRDAVRKETFCFRSFGKDHLDSTEFKYMSINEIVNGTEQFCGLVPLIKHYLDEHLSCVETRKKVDKYLSLVSRTASGQRPTAARRIRQFVSAHPEYKRDSIVSEKIQYDLINHLSKTYTQTS